MAVNSDSASAAAKKAPAAPTAVIVHNVNKIGDPRRPSEVVDYKWPVADGDKQRPDLPQVGGLIFGALGIMLKNKYFSWGSLLCGCIAFAVGDRLNFNFRNSISSGSFALVGIVTSIIRPSEVGGFGPLIAPYYAMLFKNVTVPAVAQ